MGIGFLKPDETIEACALREVKEETNLNPSGIFPVGVFSNPDRDPRGRIVSNAFAAIVNENDARAMSGSDAIDAKWFTIDYQTMPDGNHMLILENENEKIDVEIKETESTFSDSRFEIVSNTGLAFDHAKIIVTALRCFRDDVEIMDSVFAFLPEKFTFAELQKVYELLMGETVITANFRRKMTEIVEETEEITCGAGHRPAKLFKRKI